MKKSHPKHSPGKPLKDLLKTRRVVIIIAVLSLVLGSSVAYATYRSLQPQPPFTLETRHAPSPQKNLSAPTTDSAPSTSTSQQSAAPPPAQPAAPQPSAPATSPPSKQSPPAKPKVDPKADCPQRIAALRVPYDAEIAEAKADHQDILNLLKLAYDEGVYDDDPEMGGTQGYYADVSQEHNRFSQESTASLNRFYEKIKAIGCWF